jgi:hypothetical protein
MNLDCPTCASPMNLIGQFQDSLFWCSECGTLSVRGGERSPFVTKDRVPTEVTMKVLVGPAILVADCGREKSSMEFDAIRHHVQME